METHRGGVERRKGLLLRWEAVIVAVLRWRVVGRGGRIGVLMGRVVTLAMMVAQSVMGHYRRGVAGRRRGRSMTLLFEVHVYHPGWAMTYNDAGQGFKHHIKSIGLVTKFRHC